LFEVYIAMLIPFFNKARNVELVERTVTATGDA